jgi:hypothetical protein
MPELLVGTDIFRINCDAYIVCYGTPNVSCGEFQVTDPKAEFYFYQLYRNPCSPITPDTAYFEWWDGSTWRLLNQYTFDLTFSGYTYVRWGIITNGWSGKCRVRYKGLTREFNIKTVTAPQKIEEHSWTSTLTLIAPQKIQEHSWTSTLTLVVPQKIQEHSWSNGLTLLIPAKTEEHTWTGGLTVYKKLQEHSSTLTIIKAIPLTVTVKLNGKPVPKAKVLFIPKEIDLLKALVGGYQEFTTDDNGQVTVKIVGKHLVIASASIENKEYWWHKEMDIVGGAVTADLKEYKEEELYLQLECRDEITAEIQKIIMDAIGKWIIEHGFQNQIEITRSEIKGKVITIYFIMRIRSPVPWWAIALILVLLITLIVVIKWTFGEVAPVVAGLGLLALGALALAAMAEEKKKGEKRAT